MQYETQKIFLCCLLYPKSRSFSFLLQQDSKLLIINISIFCCSAVDKHKRCTHFYQYVEGEKCNKYCPYTFSFVFLDELDEDYGPVLTIDETISKITEKHLDIPFWGWLVIGIATGAAVLAIIWVSLFLCNEKRNMLKESSNNENEI